MNIAASSRQAPSAGDAENYHPGRRQRSRRRDVHAVPDDFVRVSPPAAAVADTVRRQVNSSDVHAKSPQFWAQPVLTSGSKTVARSRSRPRPPFVLERGVQRGEISGEYVRNAVDSGRLQEQQLTDDPYHRQRYHQRQQQQQQQQQNHAVGLNKPSVEFAARCAVDCRPQISPNPTSLLPARIVTSPPPASLSPPYLSDNKMLLKEALMSAAAAKLARSSSARSALVKPLVVVRNGPSKSSSDEHVATDADDDAMTTTTTVKSPLCVDGPASPTTVEPPEHTSDVAVAAAAAAAAAATRRSRTRRQDANQSTSSGVTANYSAIPGTSLADSAGTRTMRAVNRDAAAGNQDTRNNAAASSVSGIKMQDSTRMRGTRTVDSGASASAAARKSPSSNSDHVDDRRRAAALLSTPTGTSNVSETSSKTNAKKTASAASDNRKDPRQSTSDKPRKDCDIERGDKTVNDNNVTGPETTSVIADTGTRQESPSSTSKVSFVKTILSRTRSPSPNRGRRSRSKGKALHTSPRPSSVKRLGAEVAQRISQPVKGYLKHLRERSSQRRGPAEPDTGSATKTTDESQPTACQDGELASTVDSQSKPSDECPSAIQATGCDKSNRSTEDVSSRGRRRFKTDRNKQDGESSALTSQWKSTSELTTPMNRLDNLLKANSLQHIQTSRTNKPPVDETASTSSSTSSRLPLLSKTSQSAGCLLSSDAQRQQSVERQRATTMSRCYLEKPPRTARRAMTVQLDRQQTPSLPVKKRQSTSQADLRNPQSVDEEPADSSKSMKDDDISKQSTDGTTPATTTATSTSASFRQLRSGNQTSPSSSASQNERDLRELYEQKRLERQLEEKLAVMEKQRADMIAKLWSQIDQPRETNTTTRPRTPAITDHLRDSSSSSGLVLPLSYNRTSPTENNNQVATRSSFEPEALNHPTTLTFDIDQHAAYTDSIADRLILYMV